MRARAAWYGVIAMTAAIALAGCSQVLDAGDAERLITDSLTEQLGAEIASVDCPDEVEVEAAATFTCQVTGGDGSSYALEVSQGEEAGEIAYDAPLLHTGTAEQVIRDGVQAEAVVCPDLVEARAGTTLTCTATIGGEQRTVAVTVTDDQGTISFELSG